MLVERRIAGRIAVTSLVAAVLAVASRAGAEINLNQYFSKVPSSTMGPSYSDPPPTPYFGEQGYPRGMRGAPQQYSEQVDPFYTDDVSPPGARPSAANRPMDYEATGQNYQGPRSRGPMRTAMRETGSGAAAPPMSGTRTMQGQAPLRSYSAAPGGQPMSYRAGRGYRGAPRTGQNPTGPVVGPNAVYLDGTAPPGIQGAYDPMLNREMIESGPVMDGGVMMEGGPMMPGPPMYGSRGPDGFTNPYCNDCSQCGPGGCADDYGNCGHRGGWRGDCLDCGSCCGQPPDRCCWLFAPVDWLCGGMWHQGPYWGPCDPRGNWTFGRDFSAFAGVQAFQSSVDLGQTANYGFNEGFNWGVPLWRTRSVSGQFGMRFTQNNVDDDSPFSVSNRTQTFLTTGLFHRPVCGQGLQYGLVFDWLRDHYYQDFNVAQLRGEISWLWDCRNEMGFAFAAGVQDDTIETDIGENFVEVAEYSPINQYVWFYRRQFCNGGDGRVFAGFATGVNGGLLGADFNVPIAARWSIDGGFNYLFAGEDHFQFSRDTWNIGLNLVWNYGGNCGCKSLSRPLFDPADNGSFMVHRSRPRLLNGTPGNGGGGGAGGG